jgi:hypothetical protein
MPEKHVQTRESHWPNHCSKTVDKTYTWYNHYHYGTHLSYHIPNQYCREGSNVDTVQINLCDIFNIYRNIAVFEIDAEKTVQLA